MCKEESSKIFGSLYDETYQDVLKYVICNCSNMDDVKDIVQNIYLEVLKKITDDIPSNINKSYIMGITKNKVYDYYRFNYKAKFISLFSRKSSDTDISVLDTISSDIDIEKDIIQKEDLNFIWNYLKKKKIIIFKIFYLYYYMGYDLKTIAEQLCISVSNVKNYLYRTVKELNDLMKVKENENE